MTLKRKTVYWKLLDSISETESSSALIRLFADIKNTAQRQQLNCTTHDAPAADDVVGAQLAAAIGRSLQRNPSVLPSIGNEIMIEGESWHVILSATAIPHLPAAVAEREQKSALDRAYRGRIVRSLIVDDESGYGLVEDDCLHGRTWDLYFFCKIRAIKLLQELFSRRPIHNKPLLRPPDRVLNELSNQLRGSTTFQDDPGTVRSFLDECDHVFLELVGTEALARYLEPCGLAPKKFLRAQR